MLTELDEGLEPENIKELNETCFSGFSTKLFMSGFSYINSRESSSSPDEEQVKYARLVFFLEKPRFRSSISLASPFPLFLTAF